MEEFSRFCREMSSTESDADVILVTGENTPSPRPLWVRGWGGKVDFHP